MLNMSVDRYLSILESATPEDNPFATLTNPAPIGAAFTALAHSFVGFVRAARDHEEVGFEAARSILEEMVHYLPESDAPDLLDLLASLEGQFEAGAEGRI